MAEAIRGILLAAQAGGAAVPQSGATVTVYKAGTANLALLFSDDALTASITNPLTTEADGSYFAYAANGKYDLVFAKTGVTFDATDSVGEVLWDEQIVRSTSVNDAVTEKDYILLVDASGGAKVIDLLALAGVQAGRPWIVIKTDTSANSVTLDPSGAETINGASTLVLSSAKQGVVIRKAGTEWQTDMPSAQTTSGAGKIPLGRSSDGKLDYDWLITGQGWLVINPEAPDRKFRYETEHFARNNIAVSGQIGVLGWLSIATIQSVLSIGSEDGYYVETSNVANNVANLRLYMAQANADILTRFARFTVMLRAALSAITTVKAKVGLFNSTADGDLFAGEYGAFFHFDPGISANWRAITTDNGTATATDTGVAPVAATPQNFKIIRRTVADGGVSDFRFYINDTLVATHTTNLPSAGTQMFYGSLVETSAAVTRYIWTGYSSLFAKYA